MKKIIFITIISILLATVFLSACAPVGPDIRIENAWVRPDPLWENAAGYFLIVNNGDEVDTLIGVRLDFANMASLHESTMEGDVHKMLPIDRLEIPEGEEVEFKSLGRHIMIMGLDEGLEYGQLVSIVLIFEKSGEIEVEAELRAE